MLIIHNLPILRHGHCSSPSESRPFCSQLIK